MGDSMVPYAENRLEVASKPHLSSDSSLQTASKCSHTSMYAENNDFFVGLGLALECNLTF